MRPAAAAVPLLLALLLAGCVGPGAAQARLSFDNLEPGPVGGDGTASCGDGATLSVALQAQAGNVTLRVLDGAGAEAFSRTYEAPDGGSQDHPLFGAAGTRTLVASGDRFQGSLDASLSC